MDWFSINSYSKSPISNGTEDASVGTRASNMYGIDGNPIFVVTLTLHLYLPFILSVPNTVKVVKLNATTRQ